MKKFLKLTTLVVSMVMALTFVSCANGNTSNNGNENSNEEELNLVGTYGISKVEVISTSPTYEVSIIRTMPTSIALHEYFKYEPKGGNTATVTEKDYTVNKITDKYSFNWAKFDVDGVAQDDAAKTANEEAFTDNEWNNKTALFAMTITTTAEGTWNNNYTPATSGTYTVDKANSEVTIKTLIRGEETLAKPEIMEATYSNNGKTLVVVMDDSTAEETLKTTMTFTRK